MSEFRLPPFRQADPHRCQAMMEFGNRCGRHPEWIAYGPRKDHHIEGIPARGSLALCDHHRAEVLAECIDANRIEWEPLRTPRPPTVSLVAVDDDPVEVAHMHEQSATDALNRAFQRFEPWTHWTQENSDEIRDAVSSIVMAAIFQGKAALAEVMEDLKKPDSDADLPIAVNPFSSCPHCGETAWTLYRHIKETYTSWIVLGPEEPLRVKPKFVEQEGDNLRVRCEHCLHDFLLDSIKVDWLT